MSEARIRLYLQVGDGAIQPVGHATGDDEADLRAATAALLRSMSSHIDTDAAFLETVLRYDEEDT